MSNSDFKSILLFLAFAFLFATCAGLNSSSEKSRSETTTRHESNRDRLLRQDVVEYARHQLGSKYRYGGRDPNGGFDCSGFTYYVYKKFDVSLPTVSSSQAKEGKAVNTSHAKKGDLIFFKKNGRIFHVALIVSNDSKGLYVIHSTSRGVVIDNVKKSDYWRPKISHVRGVL